MQQSTPVAVGMDIGDRKSVLCVLDTTGEVIERTEVPTTKDALNRYFRRLDACRVAMEVGTHSPWISRLVAEHGHEVFVANPRKLRAIYENDRKTDRTDAHLLAEVVQLKPSLLRPIQHRKEEAQADRALMSTREALVRVRSLLVNHVRGIVKSCGGRLPSKDAEQFHKLVESLPDERRAILEPVMKHIGETTALIRGFDKEVKRRCEADPDSSFLLRVGGVGHLTTLAFMATVEDPNRFPKSRHIGSYVGLRPRLDESGDTRRQLGIAKSGDGYLRKLLVNCAQYILGPFGPDSDLRRWGTALSERGGKNAKKRATVAVARKLSVLLLTLWKTKATYEPLRLAQPKEGASIANPLKSSGE